MPKIQSTTTRRAIRPYVGQSDRPCSMRLANASGIAAPTTNRKIGMITSQALNPAQSGWSSWAFSASSTAGEEPRQAAAANSNSLPPMIQNMVKPRRTSRESSRWLDGTVGEDEVVTTCRFRVALGVTNKAILDSAIPPSFFWVAIRQVAPNCSGRWIVPGPRRSIKSTRRSKMQKNARVGKIG